MSTTSIPKRLTIQYYQGEDAQWYWRMVRGNGRITSDGAEGYSKEFNVLRACKKEAQALHPSISVKIEKVEVTS